MNSPPSSLHHNLIAYQSITSHHTAPLFVLPFVCRRSFPRAHAHANAGANVMVLDGPLVFFDLTFPLKTCFRFFMSISLTLIHDPMSTLMTIAVPVCTRGLAGT